MKFIYRKWILIILMLLFISACAGSESPVPITPTNTASIITPIGTDTAEGGLADLGENVPTRTPEPTATPGAIAQGVTEFVDETNLEDDFLFWLKIEDWINLGISLFFVLGSYLIGTWAIRWLLPKIVQKTTTPLDDRLLKVSGSELRWFIVILILQFATDRLTFLSFSFKNLLGDIYFLAAIALIVNLSWRLINLAADEARQRAVSAGRPEGFASLLVLFVWVLRFIVIVVGLSISLSYFGVNVTGFAILLAVALIIISLAGSDTVGDMVAGAMILIDRPFRIGDRIDIPDVDTWGDVVSIGMRSTQVLTRDHRMVIVPNSEIGKSQIVNYSYPDSHYRLQSYYLVSDGRDLKEIRQIIINTVREIEGVLEDKPVNALVEGIGDGSIQFRVRWWISSYTDTRAIYDRVNTAVYYAIKSAGVKLASDSYDLNVNLNSSLPMGPSQPEQKDIHESPVFEGISNEILPKDSADE